VFITFTKCVEKYYIQGLAVTVVALTNSTQSAASKTDTLKFEAVGDGENDQESGQTTKKTVRDDCTNMPYFHLVFALGAMYACMLITHWAENEDDRYVVLGWVFSLS